MSLRFVQILLLSMMFVTMVVVAYIGEQTRQHGRRTQLEGLGCEGASGPLYAEEEDHFPRCREIRRRR